MTSPAEANAKFACDFYHLLSKEHPNENIVFSPVNLFAALNLLCYASQHDTRDKLEKVLHLKKTKGPLSSGTGCLSKAGSRAYPLGSKQGIASSAKKGNSLLPTSKEDGRRADGNLVLSATETSPQPDAEEDTSSYFIPWRKHLVGREEPKDLIPKQSSPKEKLSRNPEKVQPGDVLAAKASPATSSSSSAEVVAENMSSLLSEFRCTVKHADDSVKAFKETCLLFQECCEKMCTSMSNLQNVLENLTQILKE